MNRVSKVPEWKAKAESRVRVLCNLTGRTFNSEWVSPMHEFATLTGFEDTKFDHFLEWLCTSNDWTAVRLPLVEKTKSPVKFLMMSNVLNMALSIYAVANPATEKYANAPGTKRVPSVVGSYDDFFVPTQSPLEMALCWSEDVLARDKDGNSVTFTAKQIRRAILYHTCYSDDPYYRDHLSAPFIRSRVQDFVERVPTGWNPKTLKVADPDCPMCNGSNQVNLLVDGYHYTNDCDCARELLRLPKFIRWQEELHGKFYSDKEGQREVYQRMQPHFLKGKNGQ